MSCLLALLLLSTTWNVIASNIQLLHDGTFQERIREGNWLVIFSSSWCGTCKALGPIIEEVAKDQRLIDAGVMIGKVDVQTDPSTASDENTDYIPSIYFYNRKSNIRIPFKDSLAALLQDNASNQQNRLREKIISFVLDQNKRYGPSRSQPNQSKASGSTDLLARALQMIQQVAGQNLLVFTTMIYTLGLAQGLFVGVLYRIRAS